jgi:phospholipid/cholesterol/gamma-HCH transport system substrate-binding protein
VNYVLVGAFVIALGGALIGLVLWLASGGALQKKYDFYAAIEDESVSGLNLNAPVKYNGVEVGKVRAIKLDPFNPQRVNLLFAIERGTPIKVSTVATLKTQGLTGIAYVELSGGTQSEPLLVATESGQYPTIRTKPSLSARLENMLSSVLGKIDTTSNSLNAILSDENLRALKSSLSDIAVVARTISGRKDAIDAGLLSASRAFENSSRITARLEPQIAPLIDKVSRSADSIEKMGVELALASASATKTIDVVGADVQRFSSRSLPELDRLLSELSTLTVSLHRLSEQTERDPRSLIFGRRGVPEGPGEMVAQ